MSAKRAFAEGVARTLDLFGNNYSENTKSSKRTPSHISCNDARAIGGDWIVVGNDIRKAMKHGEKVCS